MSRTNFNELLEAGVHFGHLKRKWNPNMAPYIFMEKNGIHIIDLHKTVTKLDDAALAMKQIAKSGRKILFVATKKQAKELVSEKVKANTDDEFENNHKHKCCSNYMRSTRMFKKGNYDESQNTPLSWY